MCGLGYLSRSSKYDLLSLFEKLIALNKERFLLKISKVVKDKLLNAIEVKKGKNILGFFVYFLLFYSILYVKTKQHNILLNIILHRIV